MAHKARTISQLPHTITKFVREARDELKKVAWPDRPTAIRYTIIVVVSSIAVGGLMGGVDYILSMILETFVL